MVNTDVERSKKTLVCAQCGVQGEATLQNTHGKADVTVISVTKEFKALEVKTMGTPPGFSCQGCGSVVH